MGTHLPLFPTMSWNPFTNTHGPHGGPPPAYMSNNVFRPMPYPMPAPMAAPMPIPMPMAAPIFAPPIFMALTFGGYGGAYAHPGPMMGVPLPPMASPAPSPRYASLAFAECAACGGGSCECTPDTALCYNCGYAVRSCLCVAPPLPACCAGGTCACGDSCKCSADCECCPKSSACSSTTCSRGDSCTCGPNCNC